MVQSIGSHGWSHESRRQDPGVWTGRFVIEVDIRSEAHARRTTAGCPFFSLSSYSVSRAGLTAFSAQVQDRLQHQQQWDGYGHGDGIEMPMGAMEYNEVFKFIV